MTGWMSRCRSNRTALHAIFLPPPHPAAAGYLHAIRAFRRKQVGISLPATDELGSIPDLLVGPLYHPKNSDDGEANGRTLASMLAALQEKEQSRCISRSDICRCRAIRISPLTFRHADQGHQPRTRQLLSL